MMAEKRDEMLARRSKMLRWRKGWKLPQHFSESGLASELAKNSAKKIKMNWFSVTSKHR